MSAPIEEGREGEKEGGKKGEREGERKAERVGGKEGGKEGGREGGNGYYKGVFSYPTTSCPSSGGGTPSPSRNCMLTWCTQEVLVNMCVYLVAVYVRV